MIMTIMTMIRDNNNNNNNDNNKWLILSNVCGFIIRIINVLFRIRIRF